MANIYQELKPFLSGLSSEYRKSIFGRSEIKPFTFAPDQTSNMKLAVVGVTGLVGQEICRVLEERRFQVKEHFWVSSHDWIQ